MHGLCVAVYVFSATLMTAISLLSAVILWHIVDKANYGPPSSRVLTISLAVARFLCVRRRGLDEKSSTLVTTSPSHSQPSPALHPLTSTSAPTMPTLCVNGDLTLVTYYHL